MVMVIIIIIATIGKWLVPRPRNSDMLPIPLIKIVVIVVELLSRVQLFVTPWTVAHQAPMSMEFSRQEYWGGWPFPSPGDLPNPGTEPRSLTLKVDLLPSERPGKTNYM